MNASTLSRLDITALRKAFPILTRNVHGKPLVYFDNAATTQKPDAVIEEVNRYYRSHNANIHRAIHALAEEATQAYETSRTSIQRFINAPSRHEVIFTGGVTEGINLIAATYGRAFVKEGDEILISEMEHHSNIVPWQLLCQEKKAALKVIPINPQGEIDIHALKELLTEKTSIVAINHASNSLGTINDVKEITRQAHAVGALVAIDGAQAGAHLPIDVQDIDADFYCLSAHKMYGPTGIGALYGKEKWLEKMPPYMGGGEMIEKVTFAGATYNELPYKFEAGTPNIAGGVAFHKAIEFINELGKETIGKHEDALLAHADAALATLQGAVPIGTATHKVGILSYMVEGIHPFDIGQMLDSYGIAVRTGHHCTQPLMDKLGIEGTVRISFALYNTREEIELWREGMERIIKTLR